MSLNRNALIHLSAKKISFDVFLETFALYDLTKFLNKSI